MHIESVQNIRGIFGLRQDETKPSRSYLNTKKVIKRAKFLEFKGGIESMNKI